MDDLGSPDLLTALLGLVVLGLAALGVAWRALLRPPPTHPDELPPAVPSRSTAQAKVELEDAAHRREKLRDEIAAAQQIPDEVQRREELAKIGRRERARKRP